MVDALFAFLIFLVILCLAVALVLWSIRRFFPDIYEPAKYVVGGLALIAILYRLRPLAGYLFP